MDLFIFLLNDGADPPLALTFSKSAVVRSKLKINFMDGIVFLRVFLT